MHIHPSSPNSSLFFESEESAAIKIQAGFRGYRVRKQLHHHNRPSKINGYSSRHNSIEYRQNQKMDRKLQKTESISMSSQTQSNGDTASDDIENRCATKIQAGVRGFLVRKKQKVASDAATKIQAGFRGFKARKEAQKLKQK